MISAKYFLTLIVGLSCTSMYAQHEPNSLPVNPEDFSLPSDKGPTIEKSEHPIHEKKEDELDEKYAALKAGDHKKYTELIKKDRDFCKSLESAILAEDNASCKQLTRDKNNTEAAVENYQNKQKEQRRIHPLAERTLIFAGGVAVGALAMIVKARVQ